MNYKASFPFTDKDYVTAVFFSISIFCGLDKLLPQIWHKVPVIAGFSRKDRMHLPFTRPAMLPGKPCSHQCHQPVEGRDPFYEAHVQSEEGWNMLGGAFSRRLPHLSWTKREPGLGTYSNYQDKIDLYQIGNNPAIRINTKLTDMVDLEVTKIKLRGKGVPVGIGRTIYWSNLGLRKNKAGCFFSPPCAYDGYPCP